MILHLVTFGNLNYLKHKVTSQKPFTSTLFFSVLTYETILLATLKYTSLYNYNISCEKHCDAKYLSLSKLFVGKHNKFRQK